MSYIQNHILLNAKKIIKFKKNYVVPKGPKLQIVYLKPYIYYEKINPRVKCVCNTNL